MSPGSASLRLRCCLAGAAVIALALSGCASRGASDGPPPRSVPVLTPAELCPQIQAALMQLGREQLTGADYANFANRMTVLGPQADEQFAPLLANLGLGVAAMASSTDGASEAKAINEYSAAAGAVSQACDQAGSALGKPSKSS